MERVVSLHPVGELSPTGILDVGLSCPHSCRFCYYSHFDGHEDQFHALRSLPFRDTRECTGLIDDFASWGLTHSDITGGEPTLHPEICEIVRYLEQERNIRGRMITLAQFTMRKNKRTGNLLVDDLLDAGLSDFLFSVHGASEETFKLQTRASLAQVKRTMEHLDALDLSYTSNTVVQEYNFRELPELARYLADRNIRFHNFIVMKLEWGWRENPDGGVVQKARYRDIEPFLREAVQILEAAGKGVNIRYAPYCALPGLERNIVGYKQVQLDPYEWRNGTRGEKIEGTPYGGKPFLFYENVDAYLDDHPKKVDSHDAYNMTQGDKCGSCALRGVCDGVDRDYVKAHGWDEFTPVPGRRVDDLTHFRKDYPRPYEMLQKTAKPQRETPQRTASAPTGP